MKKNQKLCGVVWLEHHRAAGGANEFGAPLRDVSGEENALASEMGLAANGMIKKHIAAGVPQPQVDDHHVEPMRSEVRLSFFPRGRRRDFVAILFKCPLEDLADGDLVVNNERTRALPVIAQSTLAWVQPKERELVPVIPPARIPVRGIAPAPVAPRIRRAARSVLLPAGSR